MINRVQMSKISATKAGMGAVNAQPIKPQGEDKKQIKQLMDSNAAASLKPISFKGDLNSVVSAEQGVRINDFCDLDGTFTINNTDNDYGATEFERTGDGMIIRQDGHVVFHAEYNYPNDLPNITYKAGKFKPEIMIEDSSLGEGRIQMLAGSQIKSDNFTLTMPGEYTNYKSGNKVSFKGNTVVTAFNLEDRTKEAVDAYFASGLAAKTTKGYYAKEMQEADPTIVIPAGGFGTRFANFSVEDDQNKPSSFLPTDKNYRIMATSLNMGAMAGLIGSPDDTLTYISQAKDDRALPSTLPNVKKSQSYKTDGGAIAEAIDKGYIPQDKDVVILNADIITNVDITRAYHALKSLPEAAVVIPYYPVDAQRAKSFGLIGIEIDENNNKQIKEFIEKPPFTTGVADIKDFKASKAYPTFEDALVAQDKANSKARIISDEYKDTMYYGNPGIYLFSKEAAKELTEMLKKDPSTTGLGGSVVPHLVDLCNKGELKTADGKPMKVYTVPLEREDGQPGFWDDIGSAEAYLKTIKDMATETTTKGTGTDNKFYGIPDFVLNDFANNFDPETSIVYRSKEARQSLADFSKKYNATVKGNILAV